MGPFFNCLASSRHYTACVSLARNELSLISYSWRWQSNRYVTIKVTVSNFTNQDAAKHELSIARRLETNPSHDGYHFVRTLLDNFEATTSDSNTHLCLVYEPMREPRWLFQRRWEDGKLPPILLKIYLKFLLRGLDYLHSECHIIHTGEVKAELNVC